MHKLPLLVLVGSLALGGCGEEASDRPALTEWQPEWLGTRDLVPSAGRIEDDGAAVCGDFLGEVRERRDGLLPTPDPTLDDSVDKWIADAEALGLDCEREGDLTERLDELERLASEIDAEIERLQP